MRKNRMDAITDKLRLRVDRLLGSAHTQFKGANPYRQEPMSDADRINNYIQWADTPMEQEFRQQMGDQEIDKIHFNMQELMKKRMVRDARL